MTVAEQPQQTTPEAAPPAAEESPLSAMLAEVQADPTSAVLDDEIFPSFDDEGTEFDQAAAEQGQQVEAAQEAPAEEASEGESTPLEQQLAELREQFENTQQWAQRQSSDNGRLRKELAELKEGLTSKSTQEEKDAVLAELRSANLEEMSHEEIRDWVIGVGEKTAAAKDAEIRELRDAREETQRGMVYMAAMVQAGAEAPLLQNVLAQMAQHEMQTNNRDIFRELPPEQVLGQAAQYILAARQNAQNTNTTAQPTDANVQQANATAPSAPQAQPSPQAPQHTPQQAPQQAAAPFTPETPGVGVTNGAVTTAATGKPRTIREAVAAGFDDAFGS